MNQEILNIISSIYGKRCCRVAVGWPKSLSFGFGQKIFHNDSRLTDDFYGEWEIGTYFGCWRVIKDNKIVLGSNDSKDINWLDKRIKEIDFGEINGITNLSVHDVRVAFAGGVVVDFISLFSYEDEVFHIFCPGDIYVKLTCEGVWKIGKSDVPSTNGEELERAPE